MDRTDLARTERAQPGSWQRINEIVLAALDRPVGERAAFLDRSCDGDAPLRREVESLLTADPEVMAHLDRPAVEPLGDADADSLVGERIGPYLLVREIGRGGMSVVYLGVRADEEFQRKVAIKVLKPGMNIDAVVRRFRTERQILASLEHPNIAKLYEGGRTRGHLPYFLMEHVEGQPIDRYCDEHCLSIRERLELFLKVCSAVSFAHQSLVIHRDLKPSNILVAPGGEPKLLDFGIAKLLDPDATAPVTATISGSRFLTPEYASPEQVRAESMTTASDVYSLGVVLFELLTGQRPYHLKSRLGEELLRVICDHEVQRPSHVAAKKLRRRLAGDLDNIVLMALRKEPQRRYPSVEQLSQDLCRHLEGLPVRARQGTFTYRATKFLRRHYRKVALATVLTLLLGVVAVDRERQQRRITREKNRSQQVSQFLVELFKVSDPSEARGNRILAREILDRGAERIERELDQEPELQGALMNTMGRVYRSLGLYRDAAPLLERALAQRRQIHGGAHVEVAESLYELARLRWREGHYEAAESLCRESLTMRRELLGDDRPEVAASMELLAILRRAQGDYEAAESLLRKALALRRKLFGDEHPETASSMTQLGIVLQSRGDYEEAEPLFRQAFEVRHRLNGDEHPDVALAMNYLAVSRRVQGDYEAAEPLFRRVLELRRKLQGDEHPDTAAALNNLATVFHVRGDYEAAESLYREAWTIYRKLFGDEHPYAVTAEHNLAMVLQEKGDVDGAEPLAREVLAIRRQLLGEDHPYVAASLNNLGLVLLARGDVETAEPLLREALAICREHLGERHPNLAKAMANVAVVLLARGEGEAAESLVLEALAAGRELLGDEHPTIAVLRSYLAQALLAQGKNAAAEPLAEEALETLRRRLPETHWRCALAMSVLGAVRLAAGRYQEAEVLLLESYPVIKAHKGARGPQTLEALRRIVELYDAMDQGAKADAYRASLPARG